MLPSASEQYKIVNELFDEYKSRGIVSGDKWYLLDNKWYENWKNYAKSNTKVCPFEIDNGSLLERWDDEINEKSSECYILKLHLLENLDYILVPEEVWLCLEDWYHGGPCIEVNCEKLKKKMKVNIYNENENILKRNNNNLNKQCRVCNSNSRFVCSECLNTYYCSKSCQISDYGVHRQYCDRNNNNNNNNIYRGLVGISNIGNTCFMASSLQCLSNIYSLTLYFLRRQYMNHINTKNPLGTGGIIANSYAFLLKDLWLENYPYTSPSRMKKAISRFNSQFSGWSQNDSHEFLLFLLDMLHEDLNLIENKPYYENDEDIEKEKDEEIKSNLYWERFLSRNNSIITYYFTGQFVSNIECLECHYKVSNYSSFNSISLPFPCTNMFRLICLLIRNNLSSSFPINSEKYFQVTIKLGYNSQIIDIKKAVNELYSIPIDNQEIIAINNGNAIVDICRNSNAIIDYYHYEEPINFLIYETENILNKYETIIIQQVHGNDGINYINIPFIFNIKNNKITCKELYHIIYELVVYDQQPDVDNDIIINNKYSINEKEWYENISIHYYNKELNDWEKERIPLDENITLEEYCKNNGIKDEMIKELCINYNTIPSYLFDAVQLLSSMNISLCNSDTSGTNIYDCLDSFSCSEILDEENKWSCPKCKVKRRIQQSCFIQKFPKILILHLKRFSFINRNYVNKINEFVDFPLKNLDLRKYGNKKNNDEKHSYDLISVVNHYGEPSYGHYVSYCKHGINGRWFEYDDSKVNEIDEENVITEGAYILFYKCNE